MNTIVIIYNHRLDENIIKDIIYKKDIDSAIIEFNKTYNEHIRKMTLEEYQEYHNNAFRYDYNILFIYE